MDIQVTILIETVYTSRKGRVMPDLQFRQTLRDSG